jgi:hypothetical protein
MKHARIAVLIFMYVTSVQLSMQVCNVNDKNVIFEEKIASKKL